MLRNGCALLLAKDNLDSSCPQTLTNYHRMILPQLITALHGTVKCPTALLHENEALGREPFEWPGAAAPKALKRLSFHMA